MESSQLMKLTGNEESPGALSGAAISPFPYEAMSETPRNASMKLSGPQIPSAELVYGVPLSSSMSRKNSPRPLNLSGPW